MATAELTERHPSFLQGYYDTMDAGFVDEEGFLYVMSRSDDVINVAGHRLSSGALEEVPDISLFRVTMNICDGLSRST